MSSIDPTSTASPLPVLRTSLRPSEVLDRMRALSKRGRLDGYAPGTASTGGPLFVASAPGMPFESVLDAFVEPGTSGEGGISLRFERRFTRKVPAIFAAVLVLTVWPGVHLMDMFMADLFPGLYAYTWYWYLPLAIASVPLAWGAAMKKSRASGDAEARLVIQEIAKELGAEGV